MITKSTVGELMMLTVAIYSFVLLLFMFSYIAVYNTFSIVFSYSFKRAKLSHHKERAFRFEQWLRQSSWLYKHIADLLESVHWKMKPKNFFLMCFVLLLMGNVIGAMFFGTLKGLFSMTIILTGLPYVAIRMRLVTIQMKTKLEFLPAVEIFYQNYVLDHSRNLRIVLHDMLQEERLTYPIKPVFELLNRHLTTKRDPEDSLKIFTLTLGHEWGKHFAEIFYIGLTEGADVTSNLKELILDMRKAQISDQIERNRLLEIRIANFSPIFFLGIFIIINYYLNKELTIQYYFWTTEGRDLLLDALLLIFFSFLMGLYLSIKRM